MGGDEMKTVAQENLFTPIDYVVVRAAMRRLPGLLGVVVEMRFRERKALAEIAVDLGISVRAVETSLKDATRVLREECLRHPAFSRTQYHAIKLFQSQGAA